MSEPQISLKSDQVLADLKQVIYGSALLDECQYPVVSDQSWRAWMARDPDLCQRLEKDIQSITESLSARPRIYKVGIYLEALLDVILRTHAEIEVIASNLVLYRGSEAIGEMDFIWRDRKSDQVYHWECALTFFLLAKKKSEQIHASDFIGPAGHDNLGKKMARVFDRQLQVKQIPEAVHQLIDMGLRPDRIISQAFHRGMLFFHVSEFLQKIPSVSFLTPMAPVGWWCQLKDWDEWSVRRAGRSRYVPLKRIHWFSSLAGDHTLTLEELRIYLEEHFRTEVTGVMVGELENGIEVSRGFFVHSEWPKPLGEDRI